MKFLEKIPYFGKEKSSAEVEYNHEEIESIKKPFLNLVEKLKENIDSETYDVLIGDDASGRIPTLSLRDVITGRIRQAHPDLSPEEDRDKLKTYFVAGGRIDTNLESLAEFFRKIKPAVKKRVLFVTDYIASGESIKRIGEIMEKEQVPFDIATLGFIVDEKGQRPEPVRTFLSQHKIFIGEFTGTASAPDIYQQHHLAGVSKASPQLSAHAGPYFSGSNQILTESREDIKKLSAEISKEVWKK